jgi:hypothetical protein
VLTVGRKSGNPEELIGKKFGLLTVLSLAYKVKSFQHYVCKCQCGNESVVRVDNLHMGHTISCGCIAVHKGAMRVIPDSACAVAAEKVCKECGQKFTVTTGEKKWYEEVMGWVIPERCKPCRNSKHQLCIKTI